MKYICTRPDTIALLTIVMTGFVAGKAAARDTPSAQRGIAGKEVLLAFRAVVEPAPREDEAAVPRVPEGLRFDAVADHEGRITVAIVGNSHFGDDVLAEIVGLDALKSLYIRQSNVTDAGMVRVGRLEHLQSLLLYQTEITDAGLENLRGLTKLQSLEIVDAAITDVGLSHLEKLVGLQSLILSRTKVTSGGLRRLREALPYTQISLESSYERRPLEAHATDALEGRVHPASHENAGL